MSGIEMPKLRPIPIATKNKSFLVRVWRWITSIRKWELIEDWYYTLKDGTKIMIPKDFQFDGASIPRFLWGVLSPVGLLLVPGLIHDYAYKHNELISVTDQGERAPYWPGEGRAFWDRIFRETAFDVNGFALIDAIAWLALVLFGWVAWNKHRKQDREPLVSNAT